ncbi:MAG: TatD family hydrolase [Arenicellales bacterium]
MSSLSKFRASISIIIVLLFSLERAQAQMPFADTHIHFNWDQKEIIDASTVVNKLRQAGVDFAVVSSTPSTLALELKQAGDDLIVPIFSPYTHELGRQDWYLDQRTVELAEAGLRQRLYHGIGEVHFMSGFRPRPDNRIFQQLMHLAVKYEVPVLIHVDSGNEQAFLDICRRYPQLNLIFAHAGGNLAARHIRTIISACNNVTIEFSARDPWRFDGLTDVTHRLLDSWRALVLEYPDRFITGTDPVWKVTRTQTWDQADDGWDYFEQLIDYHRSWIADLPLQVQLKVAFENARRLYNLPQPRQ